MTRLLVGVLAAAILSLPSLASAQQSDDEMARHFFETGRTYFDRAQYDEAAEAFAEAYRLSGRAALLVNQARALEAAGDVSGAIAALEQAESELDPDSAVYPTIAPKLRRLRAQAEQEASATPPDEGEPETPIVDPAEAQPVPDGDDAAEGKGTLFWVGIGTASLGGVLLVTSLATGLAAHGIYSDLDQACPGGVCPPDRASDIDRGSALSAASTALLFVGLAAAAAGVTLMLLSPSGDEDTAAVALRVGPGSLLVDGRF